MQSAPKLPSSVKYGRLTAIMPFKIIQGHQFQYRIVHMQLSVSE